MNEVTARSLIGQKVDLKLKKPYHRYHDKLETVYGTIQSITIKPCGTIELYLESPNALYSGMHQDLDNIKGWRIYLPSEWQSSS